MNNSRFKESYFDFNRSEFIKSLQKTHYNIKDKRIILFMKYVYLKFIITLFQISVIVASTIITFFESMKPHIFKVDPETQSQMISICLSTYIAISTAVYKFLKIDDRKEEIYKILQNFIDIDFLLSHKIKQIDLLHNRFEDEMIFFNNNKMFLSSDLSEYYNRDDDDNDDDEFKKDEEFIEDKTCVIMIDSKDNTNNKKVQLVRKKILRKYYKLFDEIVSSFEIEDIEKKILEAKKQFRSVFSYNEIIYYKGRIVESILMDKVHTGNRTMLESQIDEYKKCYHSIKDKKRMLKDNGTKNSQHISYNKKIEIEEDIRQLSHESKKVYDDDEILYNGSWFNNLCLYFSGMCHFCLIMNLYFNLTIKRAKFQSLKKKLDEDLNESSEKIEFLCCHCEMLDVCLDMCNMESLCCFKKPKQGVQQIYYCCDC